MNVAVLRQYVASYSRQQIQGHEQDNVLNFVLRLLCRLAMLPLCAGSTGPATAEQPCVDLMFQFQFVSDLYSAILRLLTVRYILDLLIAYELSKTDRSNPENRDSLLQRFRRDCMAVLERSSNRGLTPLGADGSGSSPQFADLDSSVFSVYIEAEYCVERCHTSVASVMGPGVQSQSDGFNYISKVFSCSRTPATDWIFLMFVMYHL